MKNRTIDLALIVGLVLVAGAIVWTLFSLGGTPRGSLPDTGPAASDGAGDPGRGGPGGPDGRGVVPVDPDDGAAGGDVAGGGAAGGGDAEGSDADRQASLDGAAPNGAAPNGGVAPLAPGEAVTDDDDASGAASAAVADGLASTTDGDAGAAGGGPDPRIPAAQAPPVPESAPAELGRIGFSFVTGGEGACGIVLEPWTHVAASRELLEAYGCGAEVTVTLDDPTDGRTRIEAIIADTMNPSFSRTVNLYVGEDEPALAYGLTTGTIAPR